MSDGMSEVYKQERIFEEHNYEIEHEIDEYLEDTKNRSKLNADVQRARRILIITKKHLNNNLLK